MLKRMLTGAILIVGLSLGACSQAQTPMPPPAPAVPTPIPLSINQPGAPAQKSAAVLPGQPTPAPGFVEGSEKARANVQEPPRAPNAPAGETRPTTEPAKVNPGGPATLSKDQLLYVRSGRLWVTSADGKERRELLDSKAPSLWSPPKDPGRAWVSPSGRLVAYFSGSAGAITVSDIDGKNTRMLLERGIPQANILSDKEADKLGRKLMEQEMAWSPDESQVAFLAAPNGQMDLYLSNLRTSQTGQVVNDSAIHDNLVWSPLGTMLAFKSRDELSNSERVFIVRDGRLMAVPTEQIAKAINEAELGGALNLTWLDDDRLAFFPVSGQLQSLGVFVYKAADGSLTQIYKSALSSPDYNKATRQWVFVSGDRKGTLLTLDGQTGEVKTLLQESALAPIWTPDGKRIVYSVDNSETYDIHIINADGSGEKTLATKINFIGDNPPEPSPAGKRYFSPDGLSMVYAAVGEDYGSQGNNLENWWTVLLDGSKPPTPMTDIPRVFYIRQLSYSPDQQSWAFTGLRYQDRATHLWTFSKNGGGIIKPDAEVRWYRWLGPSTTQK